MNRYTKEEIIGQKESLLKLLEPTMTIYTVIKYVSQSLINIAGDKESLTQQFLKIYSNPVSAKALL